MDTTPLAHKIKPPANAATMMKDGSLNRPSVIHYGLEGMMGTRGLKDGFQLELLGILKERRDEVAAATAHIQAPQ